MRTRLGISVLVLMMVQAVLFGVGMIVVLTTSLNEIAMQSIPWVIGLSLLIAAPVSWWLAARMRARYWRENSGREGTLDKVVSLLA